MKFLARTSVVIAISLLSVTTSQAGEYADALSNCLTASTTGQDRIDLARWVFSGMSMHPQAAILAHVADKDREEVTKTAQALYARLKTQQCAKEFKNAQLQEGGAGVQAGFKVLGEMAMLELMRNPGVQAEFAKVQ